MKLLIQCAWCKKDMGEKPPLEDKSVTSSICEDCLKKHFPNIALKEKQKRQAEQLRRGEELLAEGRKMIAEGRKLLGKEKLMEGEKLIITTSASTEPSQFGSFELAPAKIQQIVEAGRRQLIPEEFEELEALLTDLEIYGFTPWINAQLGKLMSKIEWELEIGPSPEWEEALIACDRAFLGRELRDMCEDAGIPPIGHKKQLCGKLYRKEVPEVVAVMEPYLEKTPKRQAATMLPQTKPYVSPLRQLKDRLEDLYRTDPEEFYRRKALLEKAIQERKKGVKKTMPDFTLEDLQSTLEFSKQLYR